MIIGFARLFEVEWGTGAQRSQFGVVTEGMQAANGLVFKRISVHVIGWDILVLVLSC